jgi:putative transposase
MRRSKISVFIHFVWATKRREWMLEDLEIERRIHRYLESQTQKLKCSVLAINGMPDHVHMLIALHPTVSLSDFARQAKASSSLFANQQLGFNGAFDWQDNYAAISVTPRHLEKIVAYINNQKQHHADGSTKDEWEQTNELH